MAWETGTASNHKDLLNKLKTFLTADTDLVAAGQEWVVSRYVADTELMVKGTGLTGTDEIYVNMRMLENVPSDIYNLRIQGSAGYLSANEWDDQPGNSQGCSLSLWDDPMTYWFIANGRRFIVVAKVSTFYVAAYCGLIMPYSTPNQYPYPLYIGGNLPNHNNGAAGAGIWINSNYSRNDQHNSNYWHPTAYSGVLQPSNIAVSQGQLYWVDGGWQYMNNNMQGGYENNIEPILTNVRYNVDDDYTIYPHQIFMKRPSNGIVGELDGSFAVSGFSNGSENVITIGSDDYLVVQNVFRNGVGDFAAILLK